MPNLRWFLGIALVLGLAGCAAPPPKAGTCRQLVLEFADAGSTTARANFKFK